ncbi:tRNA-binding protein [Pseudomonas sp. CF161]|uniref:tRNA-binding protein n=1 Tax=Pseudomonas sp. CF161 TaxID=911241 RepID=UPI0003550419|nr:tRNA-binding protein [Pseudomonas sp. CF161]EPL15567.1 CsaA protein [Pseudomonas sp. CF161]
MTPFEAFDSVDIRIGEIVRVELNEKANKPAYKIWINLGELGEKTTSAQYTKHYQPEDLVGKQVVCAVNLGSRKIAGFTSEVLMLGSESEAGAVVYLTTERATPLGSKVF